MLLETILSRDDIVKVSHKSNDDKARFSKVIKEKKEPGHIEKRITDDGKIFINLGINLIENKKLLYEHSNKINLRASFVLLETQDTNNEEEGMDWKARGRLIRLVVYLIFYGLVLEIALIVVRYQRHKESHDEIHGFLMLISIVAGVGMDIYYIIDVWSEGFKSLISKINLALGGAILIFALAQLCKI